jgi:hypothetical protein
VRAEPSPTPADGVSAGANGGGAGGAGGAGVAAAAATVTATVTANAADAAAVGATGSAAQKVQLSDLKELLDDSLELAVVPHGEQLLKDALDCAAAWMESFLQSLPDAVSMGSQLPSMNSYLLLFDGGLKEKEGAGNKHRGRQRRGKRFGRGTCRGSCSHMCTAL